VKYTRGVGRLWATAAALTAGAEAQIAFDDVTAAAGLDAALVHDKPAGGIGVADYNRDGWPDLFLTGYFEPNRLYFNDRNGGFFEDPDIAAQIALPGARCGGVAAADYDNDGWPDAYLACNGANYLLRNDAGAGFSDITPAAFDHAERSEAAAWADLNADGVLDLIVAAHPRQYPYDPVDPDNYDRILLSTPAGHVDIAHGLDIDVPLAATLALAAADIDLDGRTDLYFANDRHDGNTLLLNRGPGCAGWCFDDVSTASGADRPAYSMGIAIADFDRDEDIDLYYSSIGEQILLVNQAGGPGAPAFAEAQTAAGVDAPGIGWGVIFLDADNDGLDDLYLAIAGPSGANQDRLFVQHTPGNFAPAPAGFGLDVLLPSEAAARIDYDRDGRMDLVIGHSQRQYRLYRNVSQTANHWLGVRLTGGRTTHRDALGSRVEVTTADGRTRQAERRAGQSRGATHDPALHFGLGPHTTATITVAWPDGTTTDHPARPAGRYHTLIHPSADPVFQNGFEP